jgi:glycosyltransferase involved in cell wall biosynthesis
MMHNPALPLVSIVMTVRNVEEYISETIASVLQERDVPLEVVLVDNGCTDSTVEKVLAFNDQRVRIIEGPRKGIAHALNVAYAEVRGEIIMRCDGDDLFPPGRIRRQAQWLVEHPDFGAVCGGFSTIDTKGNPLSVLGCEQEAEEITDELCNGKTRTHIGTFAMRTEAIKAAGCSREYFDCLEDIDFQLRLGEACRVWFNPVSEFDYRLHHNSVTHTTGNTKRKFYDAIAVEFQKQRRTRGYDDLQLGCPPPVPDINDTSMDATEHAMSMLLTSAWSAHGQGNKRQAIVKGFQAVMAKPSNIETWRNLLVLTLKPTSRQLSI